MINIDAETAKMIIQIIEEYEDTVRQEWSSSIENEYLELAKDLRSKVETLHQPPIIKSVCGRCKEEKELTVCIDCYYTSGFE